MTMMVNAISAITSAVSAYNTLSTVTTAISNIGAIVNIASVANNFFSSGNGKAYCVRTTLIITGVISAGVVVLGFYAPRADIDIPFWALGAFAASISVITCLGGCCLWKNLHEKQQEAEKFTRQLNLYDQKVMQLQQQTDQLNQVLVNLQPLMKEYENITGELGQQVDRVEITARELRPIVDQYGQRVEDERILIDQINSTTGRLEAMQSARSSTATSSPPVSLSTP